MPKEKLTLSVDKEVVEKAKNLGMNISEITETILKGYTSAERPTGSIYDAYLDLFNSIRFLLKEFDCTVRVAESWLEDDEGPRYPEAEYYLTQWGTFLVKEMLGPPNESYYIGDIKKIDPQDFLSPETILSNLVKELAQAQEKRNERMEGIMMAKRIIEAMSESLIKKQPKGEK